MTAQRELRRITGTQPLARFGASLASIADRNGDGHRDLVVGAPYQDVANVLDAGLVTVVATNTGATLAQRGGTTFAEHFGKVVVALGDADGDGVPDFGGAAPEFALGAGRVLVCSGTNGAVLASWIGEPLSQFGAALAGLQDVTGDGLADLAIGSPEASGIHPYGMVHVYSATTGLHHQYSGAVGAHFGIALAAIGDVNGDGRSELAIGAPDEGSFGVVRLVDPRYSGTGALLWSRSGNTTTYAGFGLLLGPIGERNGDGVPDLGVSNGPMLTSVSGANGNLIATFGNPTSISAICGIGDFDGDSLEDCAYGLPDEYSGDGAVSIRLGNGQTLTLSGRPGSAFGTAIAALGDVDGDGHDDFAVGAPNDGGYGSVSIYSCSFAPSVTSFGTGCGAPAPTLTTIGTPNFGGACSLRAGNLAPGTLTLWILGLSNQVGNGMPLPLSLAPYGFAGCTLWVAPDAVDAFVAPASTHYRPLPTSTALVVGRKIYAQVAQLTAGGVLSMSDALAVRFGNQ